MGRIEEQAVAWKQLMRMVDQMVDPVLKNAVRAEFTQRAISEWGYNPANGRLGEQTGVVLTEWEEKFLKDIKAGDKYQLDTRKQEREKEEKELRLRMYEFVKDGGGLADIPAEIRSDYITKIYLETVKKIYDVDENLLDSLI